MQSSLLGVRIGHGPYRPSKGSKGDAASTPLQKTNEEETWVDDCARTYKTARKIWIQMELTLL